MPRPPAPIQDIDRTIGANLRKFRLGNSMTLPRLAREIGMSKSMLSKIENGLNRIRVDHLDTAARVLDADHSMFFAATEAAE